MSKVYIVDDHPVVREGLAHVINSESGLSVCGLANNLSQAVQAISQNQPDILITDFFLGKNNGIKIIENLSYRYADLSILIFSMHYESLFAERFLKAGAKGYIMKTEPPQKLIHAIKKVLNGEIYVSDALQKNLLHTFVHNERRSYVFPVAQLSNRELEVYQLIGQGLKTQHIAHNLNLSVKTIETHIEHIKQKMDFKSYHDVLIHAVRWSITESILHAPVQSPS